jgi:hypothetical protein
VGENSNKSEVRSQGGEKRKGHGFARNQAVSATAWG